MRFAFCLFKYFPYGGLQRDFLQLVETCISRGHKVDVYTGSWAGKRPENLRITVIPNKGLTNHRRYLSFSRRLHELIAPEGYDAIVGFNKMPGLDIYFAGDVCYAFNARKRGLLYRMSGRCRTMIYLERSVFDRSSDTQILSISDPEKKRYIEIYGTDDARFHSLPPGMPRDFLNSTNNQESREEFRQKFDIDNDQYIILMVGSDYRRKGLDRAIRSISALPENLKEKTLLMVVGKGRKRPYFRLAKRLDVLSRIKIIGERDDVTRFLTGADLLLHPAYHETAGNVIIEALAAGLPVLTTEDCGYGIHVDRAGAGKLVPSPFSQEKLNEMLLSMLSSEKLVQWGQRGKNYVEETDVYSRHDKAADVIEKMAADRSSRTKPHHAEETDLHEARIIKNK